MRNSGKTIFAAAVLTASVGRGEVLHFEEHHFEQKTAIKMTVVCDDEPSTKALAANGLKFEVGGKSLTAATVTPASPDEVPLDFVIVAPVDSTMLRSHESLMKALAGVPSSLAALGHRNHAVTLFTYSTCGAGGLAVEQRKSIPQTDDGSSSEFEANVKIIPQEKRKSACPSTDFFELLRKLIAKGKEVDPSGSWESPASRLRPRQLIVLTDAEVVGSPMTIDELKAAFDMMVVLQPDLSPYKFAHMKTSELFKRIPGMREKLITSVADAWYKYDVGVKGEDGANTNEAGQVVPGSGYAAAQSLAENLLNSGAVLPNIAGPDQFVTRTAMITMLTSNARPGDKAWSEASRALKSAIPRSTKLDCFAKSLADANFGRLIVVGGDPRDPPMCGNDKVNASQEDSFMRAIFESAPFYYARTIEACVPDGSSFETGKKLAVTVAQGGSACMGGEFTNPSNPPAPDPAVSKVFVRGVCDGPAKAVADASPAKLCPVADSGTPVKSSMPPWPWGAGGLLLGVGAGALIFRSRSATAPKSKGKPAAAEPDVDSWDDE